jgi:hypothetical protein
VTAGPSDASAGSLHGEFPDVVDDPRSGGSVWLGGLRSDRPETFGPHCRRRVKQGPWG